MGTLILTISFAALSSKKRKNIRRERREALSAGVEIELLTGIGFLRSIGMLSIGFISIRVTGNGVRHI